MISELKFSLWKMMSPLPFSGGSWAESSGVSVLYGPRCDGQLVRDITRPNATGIKFRLTCEPITNSILSFFLASA